MSGKKILTIALALLLVFATGVSAAGQKESGDAVTTLNFWVFNALHADFYQDAADRWNQEFPDRQIRLEITETPGDELANQLNLAFQSSVGAPDIVDININHFSNFLRDDIHLLSLDDIVDPVKEHFVQSRFDVYSKDGTVYGLPTHVGATVVYYNMDVMDAAGVDIDSILTWDDYEEAGFQVLEKTGLPMTVIETIDQRPFWPMIVQAGGDYLGPDGSVTLDSDINIEVLERLYRWVFEYGIAAGAAGGNTYVEEFFPSVNNGEMGSLIMPMWYMARYLSFMPDLKGKIAVRPLPVWETGGKRSAGIGGTGTAVTDQTKYPELAKEFLAYAKLSVDSNIALWEILKFDPPRWDGVWNHLALLEPDEYFYNERVFETLLKLAENDEIPSPNMGTLAADAQTVVRQSVMPWVFEAKTHTPAEALKQAAEELRAIRR